ncbi:MAG TPA: cytochrome c [Vicinamibacterales bacterium]|nr:cytochrome c [Vicinamibacterales bacterium]
MKHPTIILTAFVLSVSVLAQSARTIWDGVYNEAQAGRGEKLYAEHCARCHGDSLTGIEAAPALTGTTFYSNWEGETLQALFERIRTSMPPDKPGSVSRAQIADILSHVLRVGGYPAGETPLDAQGPLAAIAIRMYKPR